MFVLWEMELLLFEFELDRNKIKNTTNNNERRIMKQNTGGENNNNTIRRGEREEIIVKENWLRAVQLVLFE